MSKPLYLDTSEEVALRFIPEEHVTEIKTWKNPGKPAGTYFYPDIRNGHKLCLTGVKGRIKKRVAEDGKVCLTLNVIFGSRDGEFGEMINSILSFEEYLEYAILGNKAFKIPPETQMWRIIFQLTEEGETEAKEDAPWMMTLKIGAGSKFYLTAGDSRVEVDYHDIMNKGYEWSIFVKPQVWYADKAPLAYAQLQVIAAVATGSFEEEIDSFLSVD